MGPDGEDRHFAHPPRNGTRKRSDIFNPRLALSKSVQSSQKNPIGKWRLAQRLDQRGDLRRNFRNFDVSLLLRQRCSARMDRQERVRRFYRKSLEFGFEFDPWRRNGEGHRDGDRSFLEGRTLRSEPRLQVVRTGIGSGVEIGSRFRFVQESC